MNNIHKALSHLKFDLYDSLNKGKASQFFHSSILNFAICLEIGEKSFNDKSISYEKICENIPKRLGSRSSIQNILNEAVHRGFFLKKTSKEDKRIKNYILSSEFEKMIKEWLTNHEKKIKEIKAA